MAPHRPDRVIELERGELRVRGLVAGASNHTLLVSVGDGDAGLAAIYKPRDGERPLWDFPSGTLCQREVAAYEVSEALGWGLVPPTVLRDGPLGEGSVQLFVAHDPELHYFALVEDPATHQALVRLAAFDFLVNNADRKGSHVLRSRDDGRILGVDHGLAFHARPKLRTVIWDLGGAPLEERGARDLRRLASEAESGDLAVRLSDLLAPAEIEMLAARARALADWGALPDVPPDRRPYPWPPL